MNLIKNLISCFVCAIICAFTSCDLKGQESDNSEIAVLEFNSSGCFHNQNSNLRLWKKENIVFARLIENGEVKERILSTGQLHIFNVFAKKISNLNEKGLCTTVDTYVLRMNNKILKIIDGSCDWNGFENLKLKLFDK